MTSNLTVKAMYEEILEEYEVVFLNKDGKIIKTQIVIENESATAPNPPAVFGYTFVSWDLDFSNVVSNLEIRPIYEIRTYSVKFNSFNHYEAFQTVLVNRRYASSSYRILKYQ